ncbi:Acyl-CoA N-acyltransferase [Apiospora phragmitis]|uniref:Acyl-CoA N-acyltransferase n=1 Tax=Apiospora phragmitis TaxID=2905665 RepID=A0ABR1VC61_9PEZI
MDWKSRQPASDYGPTSGVETEPDAEKSHSVVRMQMMMNPGNFAFAVTAAGSDGGRSPESFEDGTAIGFIGITRPPEVFFLFGMACWGKGYATEALEAFLATYWSKFPNGLPQMGQEHKDILQAYVVEENSGSSRVLEKTGFKQTGTALGQIGDRKNVLERVYEIRRPAG